MQIRIRVHGSMQRNIYSWMLAMHLMTASNDLANILPTKKKKKNKAPPRLFAKQNEKSTQRGRACVCYTVPSLTFLFFSLQHARLQCTHAHAFYLYTISFFKTSYTNAQCIISIEREESVRAWAYQYRYKQERETKRNMHQNSNMNSNVHIHFFWLFWLYPRIQWEICKRHVLAHEVITRPHTHGPHTALSTVMHISSKVMYKNACVFTIRYTCTCE